MINQSESPVISRWASKVVCETQMSMEYDRVMPLFEDESILLAQRLSAAHRHRVLDLGTGSGILSIAAALHGAQVIGIDVNPKAIQYANLSAQQSEVADRCNFYEGDLYGPVEGEQFDLIVVNPPFVPIPFGYRMFLSADGGPDGLDIVRRVLEGIDAHLKPEGRLLMLTMALGNASEPLAYEHLRKAFSHRTVRITTTHIYEKVWISAEPFFRLFESVLTYERWRDFLADRDLTHLYYMLHDVRPHHAFEHVEQSNDVPLKTEDLSGSWAGRLNRFRIWFKMKEAPGKENGCLATAGPVSNC